MLIEPFSKNVLVVDDNPMNLGVLCGILKTRGYQVRVATSGPRALEAVRRAKPALVMLDISMPGMDGFQVCQTLKTDPGYEEVPIIFISAHDEVLDKVKAFTLGAVDYVQKPFQAEEVLARVDHHVLFAAIQATLQTRNHELEEAKARLEELDQLKARFTAMLVHDLRNPLSAVALLLQELEQEDDTGCFAGTLHKGKRELEKCLTFLNELMEIYRTQARELELDLETLDPRCWAEVSLETFHLLAAERGIELQTGWAEDLPPIQGDPAHLDRLLGNLVSNSLKYTPAPGIVTVTLDTVSGEGVDAGRRWLRLQVQDTGRGIPDDQLPFIFNPYHQALSRDCSRGTGLGLAIVAGIAAAHHGRISAQSQMGIGTCFTVLLPCWNFRTASG